MATIGNQIFSDIVYSDMNNVLQTSQAAHSAISNLFTQSNILYGISSATEDVVTGKYLSIYNTAQSIIASNLFKKTYVLEAFASQQYDDLSFPTDTALNMDVDNGELTLKIKSVQDLVIQSIILESDSNGSVGNSYKAYANADINAILSNDPSSLFEYEKITNVFTSDALCLSMTMTLDSIQQSNGFFIKLYAEDSTQYPLVDLVEVSTNGRDWSIASSGITESKNELFIRFAAQAVRYVRVRLLQNSYSYINTAFGTRYRYAINIRQITIKQFIFESSGQYVSVPFVGKKNINTVVFNSIDKSFNDVTYSISANNGGKWVAIKNDDALDLMNTDMGLRGGTEVNSLRVKVEMKRSLSPNTKSSTEYFPTNDINSYYLKNTPLSVVGYLGGHISYGDFKEYSVRIEDITTVDPSIIGNTACILDTKYRIPLLYIPYNDNLIDQLVVKLNGVEIVNSIAGKPFYEIIKHSNPEHCILLIDVSAIPNNVESGSVLVFNSGVSGNMTMTYRPVIKDHRVSDSPIVNLPTPAFIMSKDGFTVEQLTFVPQTIQPAYTTSPSTTPGNTAANAFDNNVNTCWESPSKYLESTVGQTVWAIQWDTQTPICLASYRLTPYLAEDESPLRYNPTSWDLQVFSNGSWWTIDTQKFSGWASNSTQEFNLSIRCKYNLYRLLVYRNNETPSTPENPQPAQTKCGLANISLFTQESSVVDKTVGFEVIDRNSIKILPVSFNASCDYRISYLPAINIQSFLPETLAVDNLQIPALHKTPLDSRLCIEYQYQDINTLGDLQYYTPVCKEYRIELL